MSPEVDVYSLCDGDPCPHDDCDGTLRLYEESTDEKPMFVCNTRGHFFEPDDGYVDLPMSCEGLTCGEDPDRCPDCTVREGR